MNSKLSFVVFTIGCLTLASAASIERELFQQSANLGLLNFMSRSNELLQKNPTRSLECFNYYIPLINKIAEEYETNYKICLDTGIAGRTNAENATLEQRNILAQKSNNSCALLSSCKEQKLAADVFECFINTGSENSKTMYGISSDASVQLADLKEKLLLINNQETTCSNDVKRTYEQDSAQAYEDMNACLSGVKPLPTTTKAPSI